MPRRRGSSRATGVCLNLQNGAWLREQRSHRHRHGSKIAVGELHRDINIREVMLVGEVDGGLSVREVESISFDFGPGIRCLHVLERAPMLQQYLHGSLGVRYWTGDLADWSIRAQGNNAINSRSVSMRRLRAGVTGGVC